MTDSGRPARLRGRLLRWYRGHKRTLPWREHPTPYRVWVSEIMLQQTQVETVVPYFHRFVRAFPTPASLARAEEAAVLAQWEGLGYYRRARMLHRAAREVCEFHGGELPNDYATLLALPGMGRYTASAVASIAFNKPHAVVDGNVRRVLARLQGRDLAEAQFWQTAENLLSPRSPGNFNQALMELGATVCTPRAPRCPECPWQRDCRAFAAGHPEAFPTPRKRAATVDVEETAAALERNGRWLLALPRDGERYRGLWEFPRLEIADAHRLVPWIEQELGVSAELRGQVREIRYGITHHRVKMRVCRGRVLRGRARKGPYHAVRWFTPEEIEELPMSAPMRRAARWALRLSEITTPR